MCLKSTLSKRGKTVRLSCEKALINVFRKYSTIYLPWTETIVFNFLQWKCEVTVGWTLSPHTLGTLEERNSPISARRIAVSDVAMTVKVILLWSLFPITDSLLVSPNFEKLQLVGLSIHVKVSPSKKQLRNQFIFAEQRLRGARHFWETRFGCRFLMMAPT